MWCVSWSYASTYLRSIELSLRLCKSHSHAVCGWDLERLNSTYSELWIAIVFALDASFQCLPRTVASASLIKTATKKKSGSSRDILVFIDFCPSYVDLPTRRRSGQVSSAIVYVENYINGSFSKTHTVPISIILIRVMYDCVSLLSFW